MAFVMIFACSSCEKEGVFNPKQKIKRIFEQEGKHLEQEWTWNKNLLEKIDYYWGITLTCTERYTYDKDKVVKVEGSYEGEYSSYSYYYKITYDGAKYKRIDLYGDNTPEESYVFEYKGNKISKITVSVYNYYGWKGGFLSSIFPKETISIMEKLAKSEKKSKSDVYTYTITYTYNGANIKEQVFTETDEDWIGSLKLAFDKYDTKVNNPFYKYFAEGMPVTSKNMPLEVNIIETESEGGHTESWSYKLQYTYVTNKENFPTEIIIREIYEDGDIYEDRLYYEYEK